MSIFPETLAGGVVLRTQAGVVLPPDPRVQNGYIPPDSFSTTCDLTYLPSDCTARITPAQVNSFTSEMLCFAAQLEPDGTWTCNSPCNLAGAFNSWKTGTYTGSLKDIIADFICSSPIVPDPNIATASFVGCDGDGNLFKTIIGDFLSLGVIGPILCEAEAGTPTPTTQFLYCDEDGNILKGAVSPDDEANCYCPPVELSAIPVTPPTLSGPESSPFRIDVRDINNRDGFYWSPVDNAWRPIHENKISRKVGRAQIKATDVSKETYVVLFEGGRSGLFKWTLGDFTQNFAIDTLEGVHIKANSTAINIGAWIRQHHGEITPRMFGAIGDGAANDLSSIQVTWNTGAFIKTPINMQGLQYNCSAELFTAGGMVVYGNGATLYITAWPVVVGGFVNNVISTGYPERTAAGSNLFIDGLILDGSKLPTPTAGQNSNLFDLGWGAHDSLIQNCVFQYMQHGTGGGTGGGGFGVELGAHNITFLNCTARHCYRGTRVNGNDTTWGPITGDIPKRITNINIINPRYENCGCAIFAHSVTEPITSTDDLSVYDVTFENVSYHNCGHYPWYPSVYGSVARQKNGVVVVARAQNVRIRGLKGYNDPNYTSTFVDWLGRSGYPADGTDFIGAGLTGPIGGVVWGHGRNIKIENVEHGGSADNLMICHRAVTMGEGATVPPTDCFNFEVSDVRQPSGVFGTVFNVQVSMLAANMQGKITGINLDVAPTTGIVGANAATFNRVMMDVGGNDGTAIRGRASDIAATGINVGAIPSPWTFAGGVSFKGPVALDGTTTAGVINASGNSSFTGTLGVSGKLSGLGDVDINGGYSSIGAKYGISYSGNTLRSSVGVGTVAPHIAFYSTSGFAGQITTTAATTAYATSSDENWKKFIGVYDHGKAIDIIRRDPVRDFNWDEERGGEYAVGWGAQTSYAISKDLAVKGGWFVDSDPTRPCTKSTKGAAYIPWGIDNGKRVPYLWAAVSWLLNERDEMLERIERLELAMTEKAK